MTDTINSIEDIPSDGMIVIRQWDRKRSQGWHVERVDTEFSVIASPVNISTGEQTGESRVVHMRFGLDDITAMP